MALSVIDIYRDLLPKTNCGDCGFPTCLAMASMVVSEKLPLDRCPHIDSAKIDDARKQLQAQHAAGKWTRRDMAADALNWARERAASMNLADLPERIGGRLIRVGQEQALELPYFRDRLIVFADRIETASGAAPNRWEQVFVYNHLAQGGSRVPTGTWKGLQEFPNTVSKIKSMKSHVEQPLVERFAGKAPELYAAGKAAGGEDVAGDRAGADVRLLFRPLPRVPVMLVFWDEDPSEGYVAEAKLLFDETIVEHLDIESILFLSERIRQILCSGETGEAQVPHTSTTALSPAATSL